MIDALVGILIAIVGIIGAFFYAKGSGKKEAKNEQTEESLKTGLEIKKDDAIHSNDDIDDVRKRMRDKYTRD